MAGDMSGACQVNVLSSSKCDKGAGCETHLGHGYDLCFPQAGQAGGRPGEQGSDQFASRGKQTTSCRALVLHAKIIQDVM